MPGSVYDYLTSLLPYQDAASRDPFSSAYNLSNNMVGNMMGGMGAVNAGNQKAVMSAREQQNEQALQQLKNQGALQALQMQGQQALPGYQYGLDLADTNNSANLAQMKQQGSNDQTMGQLMAALQMGLSKQGGANSLAQLQQTGMNDLSGLQQQGQNSVGLQNAKNSGLLGFGGMLFNSLGGFGGFGGGMRGVQGSTGQSASLPGGNGFGGGGMHNDWGFAAPQPASAPSVPMGNSMPGNSGTYAGETSGFGPRPIGMQHGANGFRYPSRVLNQMTPY